MPTHDALYPYQYELLWAILREPLAASELAASWPGRSYIQYNANPALAISNRLRPLVKRGWLTLDDGIYRATDRAREAVSW